MGSDVQSRDPRRSWRRLLPTAFPNPVSKRLNSHDLWDLGSGANSIEWLKAHVANNPIGINIEDKRLAEAEAAGWPMLRHNVLEMPEDARTDIISMCHFLEHLPSEKDCRSVIKYALGHARRLVIITGPYFEDDDRLRSSGFKFNWGDWVDHASRYSLSQVRQVLEDEGAIYTASVGFGEINTSAQNVFVVDDLGDQDEYDPTRHLRKPSVRLYRPHYQEFMVCIYLDDQPRPTNLHELRHGRHSLLTYDLLRQERDLIGKINTL